MPGARRHWAAGVVASLISLACAAIPLTEQEAAGKQIYLSGTSPSGANLMARIGSASTTVPATAVPCANCHGSDGRGRPEGGIRPPDITWRELTKPYGHRHESGRNHPAFDGASLIRTITEGIDPAGQRLDPAMPRYVMTMGDSSALRAYLMRIEADRDPGLSPSTLRIGTLLPTSGAMASYGMVAKAVLEGALAQANAAGGIHGRQLQLVARDPGPDPASARAALEAIAADDIFAVLAPLTPAIDEELADFADSHGIPVIGPLTQNADGSGRFLFNTLAGLREQFLSLADFAAGKLGLSDPAARILAPDTPAGMAIAQALTTRLVAHGWHQASVIGYPPRGLDAAQAVSEFGRNGVQAVFFLGRGNDFAGVLSEAQNAMQRPYLFAAASQAAEVALGAPPGFTERIFIAYPSLPSDWTPDGLRGLRELQKSAGLDGRHAPMQIGAYSAAQVLLEALKRCGRDLSREHLVDTLEALYGFDTGLTPPLSFGPGQRTGAAGAHVVTVDLRARSFRPTGPFMRLEPDRQ